jgi:hypothetical protein
MRYLYLDILSKMTRWGPHSQPPYRCNMQDCRQEMRCEGQLGRASLNDGIGLATAELS